MRIRHLVFLLALFAAAPVTAQATQEFRSTAAGYTLQIPAEWRRLPEEEVNRLRQSASSPAGGRAFEAMYRTSDSSAHFPVVTVATLDMGRHFSREEFREGTTGAEVRAQIRSREEARISSRGTEADFSGFTDDYGLPVWDEENGVVWTRMAHPADGPLPLFTWMAGVLHPSGRTMVVLAYIRGPGEDDARVRADLLAIVRSLRAG